MKFSRTKRLLNAYDYKQVFDSSTLKVSINSFLLLAVENKKEHARLGIIVSKKNVRFAHQRNRIKRQIRESFRTNSTLPPLDIVILARSKTAKQDNHQTSSDLMLLWSKLTKKYKAKIEKRDDTKTVEKTN
jgi:ribonuclease P protein component